MRDSTIKAISLLLSYPTVELQAGMHEIGVVIMSDRRLSAALRGDLGSVIDRLAKGDLYEVQEQYVMLFDRSRTLSLNLFEHVHGESRERGGAMVSLLETYRAAGFEPDTTELPDHLPVLLEYLSTRPEAEVTETLQDAAHIFAAIAERLVRRESPYASLFPALIQLAHAEVDNTALAELLSRPDDDPTDLTALDAVWEEAEITFGPDPNAGCPQVRDMLAQMDPKAPADTRRPHAADVEQR